MNMTLIALFAILVYQILFAITVRNEKSKAFKIVSIINIPMMLLNVFTIGSFF